MTPGRSPAMLYSCSHFKRPVVCGAVQRSYQCRPGTRQCDSADRHRQQRTKHLRPRNTVNVPAAKCHKQSTAGARTTSCLYVQLNFAKVDPNRGTVTGITGVLKRCSAQVLTWVAAAAPSAGMALHVVSVGLRKRAVCTCCEDGASAQQQPRKSATLTTQQFCGHLRPWLNIGYVTNHNMHNSSHSALCGPSSWARGGLTRLEAATTGPNTSIGTRVQLDSRRRRWLLQPAEVGVGGLSPAQPSPSQLKWCTRAQLQHCAKTTVKSPGTCCLSGTHSLSHRQAP